MRVYTSLSAIALGMLVGLLLPAYGQEEQPIELAAVPFEVLHLAQGAVPVPLTKAVVEVDPDGALVYELSGENDEGVHYEVDITGESEIREVEIEITEDEVPEAVKQALKTWVPDFKPTFIERSQRPVSFEGTWYEFEGTSPQSPQELDVEIHEDGQRIVIQADLAG
jgi:hypothetical protein